MANDEAESSTSSWSLEFTPTWAVASVCFVLIALSLLIEYGLHLLAKYFKKQRRKSLIQTLDKIKSDLMLLGFISLFLTICEKPIANICIPRSVGETFLPCETMTSDGEEESKCEEQGKLSFLSRKGVQELQVLIFVLAFFHVFSSFLTFSLGIAKNGDPRVPVCGHGVRIRAVDLGNQRLGFHLGDGRLGSTKYRDEIRTVKYISEGSDAAHQMKSWEYWEAETRTLEYQFSNDPRRFKLIHQTSFGRRHLQFWSEHRYLRLPACFLRQFYRSVSKVDYFTLRHGFIMAHFAEGSNFDFQKYLRRALEKDFGVVVGVSFWIWIFSVIFIFLNAHVFYNYFWLPFIPLAMLLIVGTKLQGIITRMCVDTNDKSHVVRGTLLVRPSDHYFWFGRPKLLLHLMHFILFQNSFQLAFFTWTGFKFGIRSCFHNKTEDIVIKLVMGLLVHILCGYVTLPLYALVTQMGTSMRKAVFTEGVVEGLKRWRVKAKKKVALRNNSARRSLDASVTSLDTSPSFSTLDGVSFHVERVYPSSDTSYLAVEVGEGDSVTGDRREHHQKLGSFEGFELSKIP